MTVNASSPPGFPEPFQCPRALNFTHLFGPQEPLIHQGRGHLGSILWDTLVSWQMPWPDIRRLLGR